MELGITPVDGIAKTAEAVKGILGMFFPDKTQEERDKLAAVVGMFTAQTDIDKAEAQSSDPLQHWRGGLGWVCVSGYAINFIVLPVVKIAAALCSHQLPPLGLDIEPLAALTVGMLGLGGLHVAERIKGAA